MPRYKSGKPPDLEPMSPRDDFMTLQRGHHELRSQSGPLLNEELPQMSPCHRRDSTPMSPFAPSHFNFIQGVDSLKPVKWEL